MPTGQMPTVPGLEWRLQSPSLFLPEADSPSTSGGLTAASLCRPPSDGPCRDGCSPQGASCSLTGQGAWALPFQRQAGLLSSWGRLTATGEPLLCMGGVEPLAGHPTCPRVGRRGGEELRHWAAIFPGWRSHLAQLQMCAPPPRGSHGGSQRDLHSRSPGHHVVFGKGQCGTGGSSLGHGRGISGTGPCGGFPLDSGKLLLPVMARGLMGQGGCRLASHRHGHPPVQLLAAASVDLCGLPSSVAFLHEAGSPGPRFHWRRQSSSPRSSGIPNSGLSLQERSLGPGWTRLRLATWPALGLVPGQVCPAYSGPRRFPGPSSRWPSRPVCGLRVLK
ncbi:hypothetical protein H1C71_000131 [Ictidomys tridecemlineatus]|nr:hypothetical protein H1C71_000131 [Ictidomys tridecemlineatus]